MKTASRCVLLGIVTLALVAGCQRSTPSDNPPIVTAPTTQSAHAKLVQPVRKTLVHRIEQPGEIQAFEETPLFPRIAGDVAKVNKDIGDRVKEGEVLIELAVPDLVEKLKQRKALVKQAEAEVEQSKKLLAAAQAGVQVAQAKEQEAAASSLRSRADVKRAESQYERLKKTSAVIAQEVVDETRLNLEAARAAQAEVEARIKSAASSRIEAEARRDKARADIDVAVARQGVAEADEGQVKELLGYSRLRAPFDGVITRRQVDTGHHLQPAPPGVKAEAPMVVSRTNPVRIFVDVPENDTVLIEDGVRASVRVQALKNVVLPGVVKRSAWSLAARGRTLRTAIDLANDDGKLRPGMYAYATISIIHENALVLPASAVGTLHEQPHCWIVEEGKVRPLPVMPGLRDSDAIEVTAKQSSGKWEPFGESTKVLDHFKAFTEGQAVSVSP